MTIKEIEEITGMIRANIRYYEAEGLVVPERNKENGYRIYSREDAQTLLKIKLLRTLDVPLEEIKALQSGQAVLPEVLRRHVTTIAEKKEALERSDDVSRMMLEQEESFENLDALRYLGLLEAGSGGALKQDVKLKLNLPWRRFFARDLDYMLCGLLLTVVVEQIPRLENLKGVLTLVAMLLLEPLCLKLFATTPGKAIFGIRVLNPEEGKLSYGDGLVRTWTVMWEGEAMRIPIINYYFLYKAYSATENGLILSWEWDSDLTIKDDKGGRYVVYVAAWMAVMALNYLLRRY